MIPTKKFLKEFKEFALKGNVMELAIAVIIGGAFQGIITAFTDIATERSISRQQNVCIVHPMSLTAPKAK